MCILIGVHLTQSGCMLLQLQYQYASITRLLCSSNTVCCTEYVLDLDPVCMYVFIGDISIYQQIYMQIYLDLRLYSCSTQLQVRRTAVQLQRILRYSSSSTCRIQAVVFMTIATSQSSSILGSYSTPGCTSRSKILQLRRPVVPVRVLPVGDPTSYLVEELGSSFLDLAARSKNASASPCHKPSTPPCSFTCANLSDQTTCSWYVLGSYMQTQQIQNRNPTSTTAVVRYP